MIRSVAKTRRRGVFLSHSERDRELARDLSRRLKAAGLRPRLDEELVSGGQRWMDTIQRAIERSDAVVFLITPSTLEAKWPVYELGLAVALGKRVLPVFAGVEVSQFPAPFREYQAIPFDRVEDAIEKLAKSFQEPENQ